MAKSKPKTEAEYKAEERKQSLDHIQDPNKWNRWPVLPMVNLADRHKMGIVWSGEVAVYLVNLFDLKGGYKSQALAGIDKVEYESWDSLLDEWRID